MSVIIVSYNTINKTRQCLSALIEQTRDVSYEIIVSDNGSTDGTVKMIKDQYPSVVLIENGSNLGFGKANNIGLKHAVGKYVFYLNSDAYLENNAIKMFVDYWEGSDEPLGALGCQLFDIDGNPTHSAGVFPSYKKLCKRQWYIAYSNWIKSFLCAFHMNKLYNKLQKKKVSNLKNQTIAGNVDYITGADLFLKNNEYAYYNPDYFMYNEETELEHKLKEAGLIRRIIDGPRIVHDQGSKKDTFHRYTVVDGFKDLSSYIYMENNVRKASIKFKLLYLLTIMNPYVHKQFQKAKAISSKGISDYVIIVRNMGM